MRAQCTVLPNFYGKPGKAATACPAHSNGPARSTALQNCVCDAGYFGSNGVCHTCPDHSHSEVASRTIADCRCTAGHFNDIVDHSKGAIDDFHCVPLPKILHVSTTEECALRDPGASWHYVTKRPLGPDTTLSPATLGVMDSRLRGIDGLAPTWKLRWPVSEPLPGFAQRCTALQRLVPPLRQADENGQRDYISWVCASCVH